MGELAPLGAGHGRPGAPSTNARILLEKLPFFALAAISSAITYVVQKSSGAVTAELSLAARLGNAIVAIPRYVGKTLWPADLAVLYPHPGQWSVAAVAPATIAVVFLTIAAWTQRVQRPWLIVGWLWFLGMLVPVIGFVQVGLQSIADRYTYLPTFGLGIAFAWTTAEFAGRLESGNRRQRVQRCMVGTVALLLAGLAAVTWQQLSVWRNSVTLFDHTIAVAGKGNYLAYDNRGVALADAGRTDEAAADYLRALAIRPDYPNANNNLGRVLADRGRLAEAIAHYRTALHAKPGMLEIHNNLANALSDGGAVDEAIEHYQFVLDRQPKHVNARNGLAVALAMKGAAQQAEQQLREVLQIDPANESALSNLGNVYAMQGRREEAAGLYRQALEARPDDPRTLYNLGNVLSESGNVAEAVANYRRALSLAPVNPDAHAALGIALARLGRRAEAVRELELSVAQRPDHPGARAALEALRRTE